jgi:hypothetical protein
MLHPQSFHQYQSHHHRHPPHCHHGPLERKKKINKNKFPSPSIKKKYSISAKSILKVIKPIFTNYYERRRKFRERAFPRGLRIHKPALN